MGLLSKVYGYTDDFFIPPKATSHLKPACVIAEDRGWYSIAMNEGSGFYRAQVSGNFRHNAESRLEFPSVGDIVWVESVNDTFVIQALGNRKNILKRSVDEDGRESQTLCSNVDVIFVCQPLDGQFNMNRLERFVLISKQVSGASVVILLTKSDLYQNVSKQLKLVQEHFPDIKTYAISVNQPLSLSPIVSSLDGKRAVLIGGSGAGKSSIINILLGEDKQKIGEVSALDDKGKHTTVRREMFSLPNGGCIIDTPGIRSIIQAISGNSAAKQAFVEIEKLSVNCKFKDCNHNNEPDCAVLKAVAEGLIAKNVVDSYHKFQHEEERQRHLIKKHIKTKKKTETIREQNEG